MIQPGPATPEQPNRPQASLRELAVVIVLYHSGAVIADCLRSIPPEAEVVVVDNATSDDDVAAARAVRPDVVVVRPGHNLGFGGGCNAGAQATRRPYLAFVNPDVRLGDGALQALLDRVAAEPRLVAGPALLDQAGALRPCKRRPSALLDLVGLLPAAARWAPAGWDGKRALSDPVHADGGTVDALEGACFLIRAEDLKAIGGFDEDLFLYYEEDSIAVRLRRAGGRAVYEPRALAEHAGESSTAAVRPWATHERFKSRVMFYRKRDGELLGALAALGLAAGTSVAILTAALNRLLGRKPEGAAALHWSALRGVLEGARAPLRNGRAYR